MKYLDKTISFTLLEFNKRRTLRGAEGARMGIEDSKTGGDYWLWMSPSDINKNIKLYGEHPALIQALESYK